MKNISINPRVQAGAEELLNKSRAFSDRFSAYHLDYTWPSVGMLDLFGSSLKGKRKEDLSPDEKHLLLSISSFLGIFAANIWSAYDPEMEIALTLEPENIHDQVAIVASGGSLLEGDFFRVNVTNSLQDWLSGEKTNFHFFENHSTEMQFSTNIFSLFSIGLLSGLCPSGEGKWRETSVEEFANNIVRASTLLSGTCANYYANNYPIEQNGKNPLLYNSGLIMLPAGYSEKPQFARAVLSLCSFASENKLSQKKLYTLATNLARFPDPTIAGSGYAVASALIDERKPEDQRELLLLADKFRDIAPEVAEAMLLARKKLDVGDDWPALIERGQTDEAAKIFYNLAALGYLPFLRLKLSTLFNPEVHAILKPIRDSNPQKTIETIDELNSLGYGSDDLLLLKPFVHLWSGQIDLAGEDLQGIDEEFLEEDKFVRSCFFEIKGRLSHLNGNIDEAISFINKSLSLQSEDHSLSHLSELHSAVSVLLNEKGEIEQSILHLQESLNIRQNSFRARTSLLRFKINLAIESGDDSLFNQQEVEQLYRSCPADLHVFALAQISSLLESNSTKKARKSKST